MGAVYPQVASGFIHFVFDQVEGANFDKGVNAARHIGAHIEAMPGVRAPAIKRIRK
jgi:hypothetical protein